MCMCAFIYRNIASKLVKMNLQDFSILSYLFFKYSCCIHYSIGKYTYQTFLLNDILQKYIKYPNIIYLSLN